MLVAALAAGCASPEERSPEASDAGPVTGPFVDHSAEAGLDFHHFNGMSGRYYMAEIISPGGALVDYDGDGDLDIYLLQGTMLGSAGVDEAPRPPRHPTPLTDRLYRNDLAATTGGDRSPRLVDVTRRAGLAASRYGVGVAAGDYNGDGQVDLYITNLGPHQLLRNAGDGSFDDVTAAAGVGDTGWSVPATWLDFDRDGRLDLYVGNYVDYPFDEPVLCRDLTGARDYCGPASYPSQPDRLYRNRGDRFEDVTAESGLGSAPPAPALGAVAADFDGDGWPDLYVANDGQANNLWINRRDGTFSDEALLAGCAVNGRGKAEGSMGVDAADFDGDGDLDLFMTHLVAETNTLFRNDGGGLFTDHTDIAGLGAASRTRTGFGAGWLDYDNDGLLDLVAVNGAVKKIEALARAGDPFPLHEPNQLFRNLGGERFEEVDGGEPFTLSEVSRGALLGDLDNDGDTDLVVANNNGPARLLINRIGQDRQWVGARLTVGRPARDALGARLATTAPDGTERWGRVRADGSYAAANDPRVRVGLGDGPPPASVRVHWPDGRRQVWLRPPAGRYLVAAARAPTP